MHRIDTKTAQKDKFGAGKNGFTRGNPQTGTPATDLDDDYFDMLQEELCGVVEASGASLEKGRNDQLLTALRALLLSRKNPFGDIKSDGTVKTALENLGLGDGTGRLIAVYRIDTSRQITLPKDARFVVADMIGGGGGGGSNSTTVQPGYASAGQGGNSGSRVVAKFTVDASQKINITIGAGGAGGVTTPQPELMEVTVGLRLSTVLQLLVGEVELRGQHLMFCQPAGLQRFRMLITPFLEEQN